MTATLPVERREDLIACGLKPYPETPPADLATDADYPRYHVQWITATRRNALGDRELRKRDACLWVSNRVSDCQAAFTTSISF